MKKNNNALDSIPDLSTLKSVIKPKNRCTSILEAFEKIVELVEGTALNQDFFNLANPYIRYAARKLKLSPVQVTLLSIFVDRSEDNRITPSEIARYIGCRTTKILRLADDIDVLENLHYLRASRGRKSLSYRVPGKVLEALRKNTPYVHEEIPLTDTDSFFQAFNHLMEEKDDDEITYANIKRRTLEMLEEIRDTRFASMLRHRNIDDDSAILFIYMANLFIRDNDDEIRFRDIETLYDEDEIPGWMRRHLRNHDLDLFENNLIENVNEDGIARSDAFKLTEIAKEEFLMELNLNTKSISDKGLIKYESLPVKQLVFNQTEKENIDRLETLLSEEHFKDVQGRLQKVGMRSGFCCLFYGSPGTGKTETVYQLARQTGRDIMQVDVDKIKSCWVGDSEKNIKKLFDRYRNICRSSQKQPILLFNEADAVLGVRMEGASRAVDKMENSIQNIILQEMENLEGIMIATTNLTSNLDKAFERRFIYKIKYEKPSAEIRAQIWKSMLPSLKQEEAQVLSSQFDLSGGEIENIVRRHCVNSILTGVEGIDMPTLIESCRNERINSSSTRVKVGF